MWLSACLRKISQQLCIYLHQRNHTELGIQLVSGELMHTCDSHERKPSVSCFRAVYLKVCPFMNTKKPSQDVVVYTFIPRTRGPVEEVSELQTSLE